MTVKDISSSNEGEHCDKYTDGLKKASGQDVEVDILMKLKQNMTLLDEDILILFFKI